jgi:hypothetical protein
VQCDALGFTQTAPCLWNFRAKSPELDRVRRLGRLISRRERLPSMNGSWSGSPLSRSSLMAAKVDTVDKLGDERGMHLSTISCRAPPRDHGSPQFSDPTSFLAGCGSQRLQ